MLYYHGNQSLKELKYHQNKKLIEIEEQEVPSYVLLKEYQILSNLMKMIILTEKLKRKVAIKNQPRLYWRRELFVKSLSPGRRYEITIIVA
jgi:hypothetical protein